VFYCDIFDHSSNDLKTLYNITQKLKNGFCAATLQFEGRPVMVSLYYRKLHSSLGEQDDVLHCERVWSCYLAA